MALLNPFNTTEDRLTKTSTGENLGAVSPTPTNATSLAQADATTMQNQNRISNTGFKDGILLGTNTQGTTGAVGAIPLTPAPATITSDILTPAPDITKQIAQPAPVPVPPVATLDSTITAQPPAQPTQVGDLQLTEEEKRIQQALREQGVITDQLRGQAAYRAEQETAAGLPDLYKTQNELSSRLTALKNEAMAIPLQLQQEATGRGITRGGLQPIETAALRNNAIQALSVNSLLEASKGNIVLAQQMADRAVATKFDPIKEELAAKEANLALLMKDPALSLSDKNRARKQQEQIDAQKREIEFGREDEKTKIGWAVAAQQNGATALQTQSILNAGSLKDAARLYSPFSQNPKELEKERIELELKRADLRAKNLDNETKSLINKSTSQVAGKPYASDLEALIGNAAAGIASKNQREAFLSSVARARTPMDKVAALATIAPISAEGKADIKNQRNAIGNIDRALALIDSGVETGLLRYGQQYTYNIAGKDFDPKLAQLNAYITAAIQPYRSSITGAAWGDQEDAEYAQLFGSTKYDPAALKTRLETLKDIMARGTINTFQSAVDPLGAYGGTLDSTISSQNTTMQRLSSGSSGTTSSGIKYTIK